MFLIDMLHFRKAEKSNGSELILYSSIRGVWVDDHKGL